MAAEHEGQARTAEEISQLLYHLQVLMLASGICARRRLRPPLIDVLAKGPSMLRIAVPNKGSLAEPAAEMLREAGYRGRRDSKELILADADNDVEFFFLRPRDIAVYVGSGTLDLGHHRPRPPAGLGQPRCRGHAARVRPLHLPVRRPAGHRRQRQGRRRPAGGHRYAGLVSAHLTEHGYTGEVVRLDGAVETAITLGVADVIADVVETGTTLRNRVWRSSASRSCAVEAVLVRREDSRDRGAIDVLVRRLQGVLTARSYVLMDYDVRVELVDEACALTPGLESPTVSPLHDKG